jgi:hypothetical protein
VGSRRRGRRWDLKRDVSSGSRLRTMPMDLQWFDGHLSKVVLFYRDVEERCIFRFVRRLADLSGFFSR